METLEFLILLITVLLASDQASTFSIYRISYYEETRDVKLHRERYGVLVLIPRFYYRFSPSTSSSDNLTEDGVNPIRSPPTAQVSPADDVATTTDINPSRSTTTAESTTIIWDDEFWTERFQETRDFSQEKDEEGSWKKNELDDAGCVECGEYKIGFETPASTDRTLLAPITVPSLETESLTKIIDHGGLSSQHVPFDIDDVEVISLERHPESMEIKGFVVGVAFSAAVFLSLILICKKGSQQGKEKKQERTHHHQHHQPQSPLKI